MRQSMYDGADSPDVVLFCQVGDLGAYPLVSSASILRLFFQGRETKVPKHELRDDLAACKFITKEHVFGLDVAMDDPPPTSRRSVRIVREAIIAVVKERNRVRKLDEAFPQEVLRNTSLAIPRNEMLQIASLAMFKIQDQRAIRLVIIRVIEVNDARMGGQYVFENVHLARDRSLHVEAFLLLAYQDSVVAFPLHDPDLALATLADLPQLFVAVGDADGAACC